MIRKAALTALALVIAACDDAPTIDTGAQTACRGDGLIVSNAWVRAARDGQPTTAAYLEICNGGAEDDALIGAAAVGAQATELHMSAMTGDNMASMTPIAGLPLPAGDMTALKPGGAHLMLIGLDGAIPAGEEILIRLDFEKTRSVELLFEVRTGE